MFYDVHPLHGRHRWRCGCGRFGLWLTDEKDARRNAAIHAAYCEVVL